MTIIDVSYCKMTVTAEPIRFSARTHPARARPNNEDALWCSGLGPDSGAEAFSLHGEAEDRRKRVADFALKILSILQGEAYLRQARMPRCCSPVDMPRSVVGGSRGSVWGS